MTNPIDTVQNRSLGTQAAPVCEGGVRARPGRVRLFVYLVAILLASWAPSFAQCQGNPPGEGWVCVGHGWLPPNHPEVPTGPTNPPAPVPTAPSGAPLSPTNTIAIGFFTGEHFMAGERRTLTFTLKSPATNCNGASVAHWVNTTGKHLKIKMSDFWFGANHNAPAVDIRGLAWVSFAGSTASQLIHRWSWERYQPTSFNLPDRVVHDDGGFMRLDKGSWLTVEMYCSPAAGINTGYHGHAIFTIEERK